MNEVEVELELAKEELAGSNLKISEVMKERDLLKLKVERLEK